MSQNNEYSRSEYNLKPPKSRDGTSQAGTFHGKRQSSDWAGAVPAAGVAPVGRRARAGGHIDVVPLGAGLAGHADAVVAVL